MDEKSDLEKNQPVLTLKTALGLAWAVQYPLVAIVAYFLRDERKDPFADAGKYISHCFKKQSSSPGTV